ncbi:uncharacterized protein EI90DRAFT_3155219 [Cantharellus anzutake]|uniref:uncharacterized protein n=1 Tax=Cantharellus anzutake TaxID=1750568 RepID=UPI00190666FD|nr:uncharacterized protein EI90DRAFT_3155219 [Cantharellus anzutake]KAF8329803.1 hypothetical protein EI90DRAFT_3155219 [Cantharellus anzutake]
MYARSMRPAFLSQFRASWLPSRATHTSVGGTRLNKLANAKSPYLLQHASNPVHWYEWHEEAFELARQRDVPIFLSVGYVISHHSSLPSAYRYSSYSACHWCHVLAHESFENEDVAEIMNEHFVNIKVDREERPDVDALYMTFLQATTGGGGWPMSVFLTPSLHPFFAGTYFSRPIFVKLLNQIDTLWREKRQDVVASAENILDQLRSAQAHRNNPSRFAGDILKPSKTLLHSFLQKFDSRYGGFSPRGPKFPSPSQSLDFLITFARTFKDPGISKEELFEQQKKAVQMCEGTLKGIWEGGIRDHVGGGIARYSVDERWHVPHFEKMLYDQAQLANSALNLSLIRPRFDDYAGGSVQMLQDMVSNILEYVERDLMDHGLNAGAFWSAEDADSREQFEVDESGKKIPVGKSLEGAFYVWTTSEIDQVLGAAPSTSNAEMASHIVKTRYGVKDDGNIEPASDIQGELRGKNVLYHAISMDSLVNIAKIPRENLDSIIKESLKALKTWRDANRPRPHLDDKIVTSWNGLMISAFAKAHMMLPSSYQIQLRSLSIAEGAAKFIMREVMNDQTMELSRTWRDGSRGPNGQADDYAFFIQALLDLYEASNKEFYALTAIKLQEKQDELFWDHEYGGWFNSRADDHLLLRQKEPSDGAEPSAVSITLSNLVRLSHIDTSRYEFYNDRIDRTITSIASLLERAPHALANSLSAFIRRQAGYRQFIVSGPRCSSMTKTYIDLIHKNGSLGSDVILIHLDPDALPKQLAERNEVLKGLIDDVEKRKLEGREIPEDVRLCEGFTCQLPVSGVDNVKRLVTGAD